MKKEGWPGFPFSHWESMKKWDMASLRVIASHLAQKTSAQRERSGSGYRGDLSDMEKQICQHVGDLEQQVFELEDVVQALLQLIDDNRPSQRARRVFHWVSEGIRRFKQRMQQSTLYAIIGLLGAVALLYTVGKYLFHFLGR